MKNEVSTLLDFNIKLARSYANKFARIYKEYENILNTGYDKLTFKLKHMNDLYMEQRILYVKEMNEMHYQAEGDKFEEPFEVDFKTTLDDWKDYHKKKSLDH